MQQVEMNYKLQDVLTEQLYQLEDRLGVVLTQAEQPLEAREDSTRAGDSALYYKLNEQGKAMQSMIDKVSNIINRLEV